MLRPWFPKPAQVLRDALSDDAQAASIPASGSSLRLAGLDAPGDALTRCASHISIDGFHRETDDDEYGSSSTSGGSGGSGIGDATGSRRLRTFERGRWYVYRVDSNHLAGTYWHGDAGDLYKSLFTLMASAYEQERAGDLVKGMSRSQSTRQLPRPASFN